jgi:hypothetical protein
MSSLVKEQAAFLLDVCKLIQWCTQQGWVVTGGELLRPIEMQRIYVKTGRSKTLASKHLDKLAIDLNFFKDDEFICSIEGLAPIGKYWESLDPKNRWGGNFDKDWTKEDNFKDAPHFERVV